MIQFFLPVEWEFAILPSYSCLEKKITYLSQEPTEDLNIKSF
jgi:hypothetical protein